MVEKPANPKCGLRMECAVGTVIQYLGSIYIVAARLDSRTSVDNFEILVLRSSFKN